MADLDDGRVLFAAFDKLVKGEFSILVLVHIPENLVDPLDGMGEM
jgi:uncharacterized protein (DUF2249 family)